MYMDGDIAVDGSGTISGLNLLNSGITNTGTLSGGTWQGSVISLQYGGTGNSLSDPNGDRIMFWDDSAGVNTWLSLGSNLSISDNVLNSSGGFSNPMTTEGDIIYGGASGSPTRLAGSGTDDYVLLYDTTSKAPYWGSLVGSSTAGNGLSLSGSEIQLGGPLSADTTISQSAYDLIIDLNTTGDFDIRDNGSSVLYINDSGLVGVNNTNPLGKLHISTSVDDEVLVVQADDAQTSNILEVKDSSSSNMFYIEANGNVRFGSSATYFDDVMVPGFSVRGGAAAPDVGLFGGTSAGDGAIYTTLFDGTSTREDVFFTLQLPHTYKHGSNISPHIHWTPTTTDASESGSVRWYITCMWTNINGTYSTIYQSNVVSQAGQTGWVHKLSEFNDLVGTDKTLSSIASCSLYRNPTDPSDTYEHDVALLGIDFHVEMDSLGSDEEYTK